MGWYYKAGESGPRKSVPDGIKTKSRRGEIGETWWSKRFVKALEKVADISRLGRGRMYARSGQVFDLKVEWGLVSAKVQGSQPRPYTVEIAFDPIPEPIWQSIEAKLADHAGYAASLLAGDMPREIDAMFKAANYPLFPTQAHDLAADCTCPDWMTPCKHVAATYYILAEAFDDDPFLILAWRGRTRAQLLDKLASLRNANVDDVPPPPVEPKIRHALHSYWGGAEPVQAEAAGSTPWIREAGPLFVNGADLTGVVEGWLETLVPKSG